MMTGRKMSVQVNIDHLRHGAVGHFFCHCRHAAKRTQMIAAITMDAVNGWIFLRFEPVIARRQDDTGLHFYRPAPKCGEHRTLKFDYADVCWKVDFPLWYDL